MYRTNLIGPVCAGCHLMMRCERNGQLVHDSHNAPGHGPFTDAERTWWNGDRWRCPRCGSEHVSGFSKGFSDGASKELFAPIDRSQAIGFNWYEPAPSTPPVAYTELARRLDDLRAALLHIAGEAAGRTRPSGACERLDTIRSIAQVAVRVSYDTSTRSA